MVRRRILGLSLLFLVTTTATALGPTWFLDRVPESVESVPLTPVQLVSAWKGTYRMGNQTLWVYAINSPWFASPAVPEAPKNQARLFKQAPWTFVALFPREWTLEKARAWTDRFLQGVKDGAALSQPGWPVVYPSLVAD